MPDPKGDKMFVNLGASEAKRRLKGFGHGVRKVQSAGRNQTVIIHTATGRHLQELEDRFAGVGVSNSEHDLSPGDQSHNMTAIQNIFANIPSKLHDELFETLVKSDNVCIERIVSHGHSSPEGFWYDQGQAEFVILLKGAARLRFEGADDPVELRPGDFVDIPPHRKHRVEWTTPDEPTIWLAVHYARQPPQAVVFGHDPLGNQKTRPARRIHQDH
jgi:cupin 2 domain-containing protein